MSEQYRNITIVGSPVDEGARTQIEKCAEKAYKVALLPDHHKGYVCPIGGVVASETHILPASVGYDIACGMKAVKLDIKAKEIEGYMPAIMDAVVGNVSFGVGRINNTRIESDVFDRPEWKELDFLKNNQKMMDDARNQLGTVGSGNHFVNVFRQGFWDDVWVGCHFGSRGLGHRIATHFLKVMGASDHMDAEPMWLDASSDLGEQYIKALDLAGAYAYAGRDWVCDAVSKIVGGSVVEEVHNHHNFAWREEHDGKMMWVGRKGSTPAFIGTKGMIASSMTEPCYIVSGINLNPELSRDLLWSTVHGAGRVMSRTEAAGKRDRKTKKLILDANGVPKNPGKITDEMMMNEVNKAGVVLRGAGVDESPHVYKRISDVIEQLRFTVRVEASLNPMGVAMAGSDVFDPFKD